MKNSTLTSVVPCLSFFSAGQTGNGFLALLMQASLVFWPAAARWSRDSQERENIEHMLEELSDTYRPAVGMAAEPVYPAASKTYQQPA